MKFIDVLHRGRDRRREPSPSVTERVAAYSLYPPHRNVQATPRKPPVKKDDKRA